jgi:hypothetical protein
MAAGLTDHTWSVKEVLCYKVAPISVNLSQEYLNKRKEESRQTLRW